MNPRRRDNPLRVRRSGTYTPKIRVSTPPTLSLKDRNRQEAIRLSQQANQLPKGDPRREKLAIRIAGALQGGNTINAQRDIITPKSNIGQFTGAVLNVGRYNPISNVGRVGSFIDEATEGVKGIGGLGNFIGRTTRPLKNFGNTDNTVADTSYYKPGFRELGGLSNAVGQFANFGATPNLATAGVFGEVGAETIKNLKSQGASQGEAVLKGSLNAALQAGIERISNKFQLNGPQIGKISGLVAGAATEGGEEAAQQIIDNLFNNRDWKEGVAESGIRGALYGGLIQGGIQLAGRPQANTQKMTENEAGRVATDTFIENPELQELYRVRGEQLKKAGELREAGKIQQAKALERSIKILDDDIRRILLKSSPKIGLSMKEVSGPQENNLRITQSEANESRPQQPVRLTDNSQSQNTEIQSLEQLAHQMPDGSVMQGPEHEGAVPGSTVRINQDKILKLMRQGKINPKTGVPFRETSTQDPAEADRIRVSPTQEANPDDGRRIPLTRTGDSSSISVRQSDSDIRPNITPIRAEDLQRLDLTPQAQAVALASRQKQLPDYTNVRAVGELYSSSDNSLPPDIVSAQVNKTYPVDRKVNLLDYLRTPDRVLKKIGLEQESKEMRQAHHNYVRELPKQLEKINGWWNEVGQSQESSERIFKWLDGDKDVVLSDTEAKVANEIKEYLESWADRLALPKDRRVSNYITHIFEDSLIEKEFDPELEKLIRDKVPGSVYDPFTEQRIGGRGYKEDVFLALDAYVKRGTRKVNMDAALFNLKQKAEGLDTTAWDYVKKFADRVNMRPTDVDTLVDNGIKQVFGYKAGNRPVNRITRNIRNATYRATLGLNIGSAVRNLTQGVNTFGELGAKWTGIGYTKTVMDLHSKNSELNEVGVLSDSFIEDRHTSALKSTAQKIDRGLWYFFDMAERINRGAAYYGAKQRALSQGKSIEQAIAEGIETARKTQFTFGAVDNPVALNSDIVKLLAQFQSFNIKQAEFIGEAFQNKEFAKLARMAGASAVLIATLGKILGYEPEDFIPFSDELSGDPRIGQTPFFQAVGTTAQLLVGNNQDRYGNDVSRLDKAQELVGDIGTATIPAFVQANKTFGGLRDVSRGYSESRSGNVRYPIEQSPGNYIRGGLFGPYNLGEAQQYFDEDKRPLSVNQTEQFKALPAEQREDFYNTIQIQRDVNREAKAEGETLTQNRNELAERIGGEYKDYISAYELDETKRDPATIAKMAIKGTGYDGLPDEVLNQYLEENNLKREDIEYALDSDKKTDEKLADFKQQNFQSRDEMLAYLQAGRIKSIDGNYRANERLLRDLYDQGVIDNNELYGLLSIEDGQYKPSSGSSSGSGKRSGGRIKIKKPSKTTASAQDGLKILNSIASPNTPVSQSDLDRIIKIARTA